MIRPTGEGTHDTACRRLSPKSVAMNLQDHIRRYLSLVAHADDLYRSVERLHGSLMPCKIGCDDCCRVYFELSLIEAFTLSWMFQESCSDQVGERVLIRAERADELLRDARSRLQMFDRKGPADVERLVEAASRLKIPCPLNEDHSCVLYQYRPVTCRLYGTPQKIRSKVVTCPLSGFTPGSQYTTIDIDRIQDTLFRYSSELLKDLVGVEPEPPGPLFTMPEALRIKFDKAFFLSLIDGLHPDTGGANRR